MKKNIYPFENAEFIEADVPYIMEFSGENPCPMFRRHFCVDSAEKVLLRVCGLGYGYYYINGKKVSEDLFTAPVSDYNKTLWYVEYDITNLIKSGENVLAVILGNGWYNEEFDSPWLINKAPWRGLPKLIAQIEADGEIVASSDEKFLYSISEAVSFNALRSGEYFNSEKYDERWCSPNYDDSSWLSVRISEFPPSGVLRKCECEPIRECETLPTVNIIKNGEKRYVFDVGKNISGYIRLCVSGKNGQILTIRYAEQLDENNNIELNAMDTYYKGGSLFQTDKFICCGKRFVWSPMFAYHGFRYIEIEGIENIDDIKVEGVFVHQNIKRRTHFKCSDEFLNKLYEAGINSSYSNMFYMLTDCPTREKLGWTNDARASCEQLFINFDIKKFFGKWLQDIYDAQREDGCLPCVIPCAGWGYTWGNGPVSDGVLFEIPYMAYIYEKNSTLLKKSLKAFEKYLLYLDSRRDADGFIRFGLDDWANPGSRPEFNKEFKGFGLDTQHKKVPVEFINSILICRFCTIAELACGLSDTNKEFYEKIRKAEEKRINDTFITKEGKCSIDAQTAVAMLICSNVGGNMNMLKEQLEELITRNDYHHDCGMVGMRYIYEALEKCDLNEYAYKIITADGYPSYRDWFDNGATSLWETWDVNKHNDSKNHHMYSCVLSYLINTVAGLSMNFMSEQKNEYIIKPYFFKELQYVEAERHTDSGSIHVSWHRESTNIRINIHIEGAVCAIFKGRHIQAGTHEFVIQDEAVSEEL